MSEYLEGKRGITVITNSLLVALELSKKPGIKVITSGGEIRSGEHSASGPIAKESLKGFYIDKAFIGAAGLKLDNGITDYHIDEADIRRFMISRANQTYLLIDHSKFELTAFTKVCEIDDVQFIITDDKAPN